MTISFIAAEAANATTLSIPTHQAGDLLVMIVYRNASATTPTIPAGWMASTGGGGNSNWLGLFFIEATSTSMTSGTWTDADHLVCAVYRPSSGNRLTISRLTSIQTGTGGIGASISYSSLLDLGQPDDAWMLGVAGHRSNDTDIQIAPGGFTNRSFIAGASAGEVVLHDTNATAFSNSSTSYVLTAGTSSNYRSLVAQLSESQSNLTISSPTIICRR